MKFSIIIVVFNGNTGNYKINNAIKSVLKQSYSNWELIVIDGGSTDGTQRILKKYSKQDKRISFVSEKDKGVYDAMNKGVLKSKGDIIYFLGSDDYLFDSRVLERIVSGFDSETSIVTGNVKIVDGNKSGFLFIDLSSKKAVMVNMFNHQGIFVRKSLFEENGLFDLKYKYSGDWDFVTRCLINGARTKRVNVNVACFVFGGLSSELQANKELKEILVKNFGWLNYFVYFGGKKSLRRLMERIGLYSYYRDFKRRC